METNKREGEAKEVSDIYGLKFAQIDDTNPQIPKAILSEPE